MICVRRACAAERAQDKGPPAPPRYPQVAWSSRGSGVDSSPMPRDTPVTTSQPSVSMTCVYTAVFSHPVKYYVDRKIHAEDLDRFWSPVKRALKRNQLNVESFRLSPHPDNQEYPPNGWKCIDKGRLFIPVHDAIRSLRFYRELIGALVGRKSGQTTPQLSRKVRRPAPEHHPVVAVRRPKLSVPSKPLPSLGYCRFFLI